MSTTETAVVMPAMIVARALERSSSVVSMAAVRGSHVWRRGRWVGAPGKRVPSVGLREAVVVSIPRRDRGGGPAESGDRGRLQVWT
jgi:hypothetical protein